MAITYKATTTGALENPSTSLTFSGPNVTVDNTVVIVGAQIRGSESNTAITGVTYNGSAMTKIGETTTGVEVSLWYIVTELTGSKNIVVSVDGNSRILAFASYYEGVNQTSPIDTFSTESSATNTSSYSVSISPTQNNCMLVDVCGYNDQNGSTAGSGQTEICDFLGISDSYRMLGSYKSVESSGSNSMSWTTPYIDTNAVVASLAPVSSIEDSAERSLYLEGSGGGQANAERNIYLGGIDNSFGERGLFLIGKDTNTSDLNLYLEGSLANIYTRESESDLEEDDSLLETFFTEQDYTDVATEDDTFVSLVGASTYFKYLFKEYNENNSSEPFVITWKGKSTLASSSSAIYLQIYNRASEEWESLDSDNSSNANAKITLSGSKNSDLENYYNEDYIISCRVYQEV